MTGPTSPAAGPGRPGPLAAPRQQRGAALLAALLVVAVVTTLVSGLLWREHLRVRTLENQRLRDQAQWLGTGSLDWARLILREDLYSTMGVDHLGEVWAIPIAETPLSDFINNQGGGGDLVLADGEETWLQGMIVDATSRFNLTSLVEVVNPAGDRGWVAATQINPEAVLIFARLLQQVGLDSSAAARVAQYLLSSRPVQITQSDGPLPLTRVQDLIRVIPGASAEQLAQLAQSVVILPRPTPVNANTADPVVLAAVLGVDAGQANQVIADRNQGFYQSYSALVGRLQQRFPQVALVSARNLGVSSEYFWVVERLRHGRMLLTQQALVARRMGPGNTTQVLWLKPGVPDGVNVGG